MVHTKSISIKLLTLFIFFISLLHFINLNHVPIFADEAIFLYQADKIIENPRNLLISLEEAQFPVMTWVLAAVHLATPKFNPLLTGRLLSVLADLLSAFFIFLIGRKIGNKFSGLLSAALYLSFPLNFFHARLVLLESLTNFFALSTVYFVLLAAGNQKFKLKYSLAIFISSLLAFFTKPLAIVSILPSFLIPIMFSFKEGFFKMNFRRLAFSYNRFGKTPLSQSGDAGKARFQASLQNDSKAVESLLKKTPHFQCGEAYRNILIGILPAIMIIAMVFVLVPNQVLSMHTNQITRSFSLMFAEFRVNLWKSLFWSRVYLTEPILLFAIICALWFSLKKNWKIIWLSLWALSTVAIKSYFIKFFFPRHLFFLAAPIALLAAYGLSNLYQYKKGFVIPLMLLFLLLPLQKDIKLVLNPKTALVGEERQEFYEDWPSGVGLDEIAKNLKSLSDNKTIYVYVENEPLTAWALPNLFDIGKAEIYPSNDLLWNRESFYKTLQSRLSKDNLYLILNHYPYLSSDWKFQLINSYPKGPHRTINLYKYTD